MATANNESPGFDGARRIRIVVRTPRTPTELGHPGQALLPLPAQVQLQLRPLGQQRLTPRSALAGVVWRTVALAGCVAALNEPQALWLVPLMLVCLSCSWMRPRRCASSRLDSGGSFFGLVTSSLRDFVPR